MRFPLKRLGYIVALAVIGSTVASAQSAPGADVQFKLRTGFELDSNPDNLKSRSLGFGLDFGFETSIGRFGAEFGFQYKPGDQYKSDVSTFPVKPGALPPSNAYSGDLRRNSLEGMTLRLSFEQPIAASPLSWRAGIQLGGAKFRHEYLGDLSPNATYTYEDTYNGALTKSTLSPSPFVGVSYRLGETSAIEFNILALSYSSINYVHVAGQGVDSTGHSITALDYTTEQKRVLPHLEIGYSFRF